MTKEQFEHWVQYIQLRWGKKYSKHEISSLYDDYKDFSDEAVGKAVIEQYSADTEYFSWSKLKNRSREIHYDNLREIQDNNFIAGILENPKNKSGLDDYLKSQGWKSFDEAVFYTTQRLFRTKKLYKPGVEAFKRFKDMDYTAAKEAGWNAKGE